MARYIHVDDLESLATSLGVTPEQVKAFVNQQRSNGNIQAIVQYIDDNPGVTETDIENNAQPSALDATTVQRILQLLIYVGIIEQF